MELKTKEAQELWSAGWRYTDKGWYLPGSFVDGQLSDKDAYKIMCILREWDKDGE